MGNVGPSSTPSPSERADVLLVDVGNTAAKFALIRDGRLFDVKRAPVADAGKCAVDMAGKVSSAWIASVNPEVSSRVAGELERGGVDVVVVGEDERVPIDVEVDEPSRVGVDRLLAAFAASMLYGSPVVVVCAGTAITVDLVDGKGSFVGGVICPGFGMMAAALHRFTASLPLVRPGGEVVLPGKNTLCAINSGVLLAGRSVVAEVVERYRQLVGLDVPVVVSGGDAELLCTGETPGVAVHRDIVLEGMRLMVGGKEAS